MTATYADCITRSRPVLYLAFELGAKDWKLGFSIGLGVAVRLRAIGAGNLAMLRREIELAKKKFKLTDDVLVCSCYEAGRDGFWMHRWLVEQGIDNVIVDAASIEVNRRYRRQKTDSLDAAKLVAMLIRHHAGEKLWSVVRVPAREEEERRHLHRDLEEMKAEVTQHRTASAACWPAWGPAWPRSTPALWSYCPRSRRPMGVRCPGRCGSGWYVSSSGCVSCSNRSALWNGSATASSVTTTTRNT